MLIFFGGFFSSIIQKIFRIPVIYLYVPFYNTPKNNISAVTPEKQAFR